MATKSTDMARKTQIKTEKDLEKLLQGNRFSAEEISAVREFCTEEMNVSEDIRTMMLNSASFIISLIKYSETLSAGECRIVFGMYHSTKNEAVRKAIENELVQQNTGLASALAKKAEKRCRIEYDDLIQEALLHLFEAIHKYDPSYNTKFSTFAYKHISFLLNRYIENTQYPFKISNGKQRKVRAYNAFENKYILTHPRASDTEIARAAMGELGFTQQDICNIFKIRQITSPEYLDADMYEDNASLKDFIQDANAESGFDEVLDECFRRELLEYLKNALPPKQYDVIVKYYGLDGNEPMSFKEIDEQRDNLIGRPGAAACIKHQRAIAKLQGKNAEQMKRFVDVLIS